VTERSYDCDVLAGDRDRERAAAALREHYARGRLTVEEVSECTGMILTARSQAEVRGALSGLPIFPDARELAARGRSLAQNALRAAVLVVFTGMYFVFSLTLLLVLGLTLLVQGAPGTALLGFLAVWLVPTYLLARLWRRAPTRR
jgi:Domain of unknown function (DUF1707)